MDHLALWQHLNGDERAPFPHNLLQLFVDALSDQEKLSDGEED